VYSRDIGLNKITVRAIDLSGNAPGHSNQIVSTARQLDELG
jgi:hypothetical protein